MKKADNQKLKMLYLAKILFEQTDERHGITMPRIINALNGYGIQADRKTLYTDIAELKNFGLNIEMRKEGKFFIYHLVSRDFDLSELKLLADCVQSSKYVSEKKSRDLIRKLESLASSHEAPQLKRQVLLTGRVKSMNESIFGSIDDIHNAISLDRQISFKYVNWTLDIKENLRRDEKLYCISPWRLRWDGEYYYLIGFNPDSGSIRQYRVDKMRNITVTDLPGNSTEQFRNLDPADYSGKLSGMFSGDSCSVTLRGDNSMVGVIIDRFGKDIPIMKTDERHFEAVVEASLNPQFFGWVASLCNGIRIIKPESARNSMKAFARTLCTAYGDE